MKANFYYHIYHIQNLKKPKENDAVIEFRKWLIFSISYLEREYIDICFQNYNEEKY